MGSLSIGSGLELSLDHLCKRDGEESKEKPSDVLASTEASMSVCHFLRSEHK
jgi:hypothetical protein